MQKAEVYNITISTITFVAAAISLISSCVSLQNELKVRRELSLAKTTKTLVGLSSIPDPISTSYKEPHGRESR